MLFYIGEMTLDCMTLPCNAQLFLFVCLFAPSRREAEAAAMAAAVEKQKVTDRYMYFLTHTTPFVFMLDLRIWTRTKTIGTGL